jgi:site-specific DNA recombinase
LKILAKNQVGQLYRDFYIDDAISGTSTVGRRAFQKMIADAQRLYRPFELIIVYDVKRFGRVDNDEAGYWRHILRLHGVEVAYVTENFSGDGTDDLLRPVKQWQAREESKDLSKVTIRGLLSKADGGWWLGGVPPYGYDLRYQTGDDAFLFILRHMPDGTKQVLDEKHALIRTLGRQETIGVSKRDRAKLIPSEPGRVQAIQEIFRMYVDEKRGFKAIAGSLNRRNIPTARGPEWASIYSGEWSDTTIRAIVVNPLYVGDMAWNRRTDGRFHKIEQRCAVPRLKIHAARLEPNDPSHWILIRDTHEALVSRGAFEQARVLREKRIRKEKEGAVGGWHGTRSRFVLSGLMTCSRCGNRYQGVTRQKGTPRLDGSVIKNFYYGCAGYITKGTSVCQMGAIPQHVLEEVVCKAVLEFYQPYLEEGGRKKLAAEVEKLMDQSTGDVGEARKRAQARIDQITSSINHLLDNITAANREFADQRLDALGKEKQVLEQRMEELDRLTLTQGQTRGVTQELMQFIGSLPYTLRQGLPEEKRAVLRPCIERIKIDAEAKQARLKLWVVPNVGLGDTEKLTASERLLGIVLAAFTINRLSAFTTVPRADRREDCLELTQIVSLYR